MIGLLQRARHSPVASGEFGAHMRVSLINDGSVTLWLEVGVQSGNHAAAGFSEQPA